MSDSLESMEIIDEIPSSSSWKSVNGSNEIPASGSKHLTASELVNLRKPSKEKAYLYVTGTKSYRHQDTELENKVVQSALDEQKEILSQKCVSRVCDLIQAEWNADLNVAVTSKLKGKYVQHMGCAKGNKIHLSPQESMFLLQNKSIEIFHEKMPMSLEKAYAVILKSDMSCEKFQVYLHLAQLGFIVVQHQPKLHAIRKQMLNRSKSQGKAKRKAVLPVDDEPAGKRSIISHDINHESEIICLSDSSITQDSSTISNDYHVLKIDEASTEVFESDKSAPIVSKDNHIVELLNEEPDNVGEKPKNTVKNKSFEMPVISKSQLETHKSENSFENIPENSSSLNVDENSSVSYCEESTLSANRDKNNSKLLVTENSISTGSAVLMSSDDQIQNLFNGKVQVEVSDNDKFENDVSSNHIKNGSVASEFQDVEKKDEVNCYKVNQEMNESSENEDEMSYSEDYESDIEDISSTVDREFLDDEVTLVEVKKTEKTPLAVIDLLSDEEEVEKMIVDESSLSDEDIKIVEICPSSSENTCSNSRNFFSHIKTEQKYKIQTPDRKIYIYSNIVFPNMYRKDVVCIERPQLNLLPCNVRPCKEAYVLDLKRLSQPTQNVNNERIWNSYRDLQEYQRSRRRNRNTNFSDWRSSDRENRQFYDRNSSQNQGPMTDVVNPFSNSFNEFQTPPQAINEFSDAGRNRNFNLGPMNMLPNIPNINSMLPNIPSMTGNLMVDIQRTAYSVAQTMLSSMMSQTMPYNMHQYNSFSRYRSGQTIECDIFNNVQPPSFPYRPPFPNNFRAPSFDYGPGSSRHTDISSPFNRADSVPMYSQGPNNFFPYNRNRFPFPKKPHRGKPFPCVYRNVRNKKSWNEVKAVVDNHQSSNEESSVENSDVEEVSIDVNEVLWNNEICPLVKPGFKYPVEEVLKRLRTTKMANPLDEKKSIDRYLPSKTQLEISFDVYLPGTNYKKTCPDIPKYRVLVVKSTDPLPKYSEISLLQTKWNDGAILQTAVVDNGDISFYSFHSVDLPHLIPHE